MVSDPEVVDKVFCEHDTKMINIWTLIQQCVGWRRSILAIEGPNMLKLG